MRTSIVFCASLCLIACSRDPASEAPVELTPGMYQVNAGGGTIVTLANGELSRATCLDSAAAAELPNDPLPAITGSWGNCAAEAEPRKGNAIAGSRTCDARRLPARIKYDGSITPTSFLINGTVAQGSDETEARLHLGSGDFTLAGKRVGDCNS